MTSDREFTVFYLKHAKAAVVTPLVQNMLSGGVGIASSSSGRGGSLMGDIAGAAFGDGFMTNLLFGGGGGSNSEMTVATGRASGQYSIIPDSRLNALFVQANPVDLDTIEQLLKVLDQPGSPEEVSVIARAKMIPVYNKSADQIAQVVQQVFSNRIVGAGGAQRQPSPEDFIRALRGDRGGRGGRGGSRSTEEETQQMTIGVDQPSNSLVVAAPENLFKEVKQLVEQLDQAVNTANNESMVSVKFGGDAATVQRALTAMLGDQVQTSTLSSTNQRGGNHRGGRGNQNQGFQAFGRGGFGGGGFQGGGFGGGGGGGGFQGGGGGRGGFQGGGFGGGGGGRGGFGGGGRGGRGGRGGGRGG
jgi:hypothetical protein